MAGMKPAPTTKTAWLWRSNNSPCGRVRLASEACRTLAHARLAGSAGSASGIRGASQRPAPEGNGQPGCGRQVPRSEEHMNSSHSQISYAVFCLKKKNKLKDSEVVEK